MTAAETVKGWTREDGSLAVGNWPWVVWEVGEECVRLDGSFTPDELEAIAKHMREQKHD